MSCSSLKEKLGQEFKAAFNENIELEREVGHFQTVFAKKIQNIKINDEQKTDLSQIFIKTLSGIYHARIEYPDPVA